MRSAGFEPCAVAGATRRTQTHHPGVMTPPPTWPFDHRARWQEWRLAWGGAFGRPDVAGIGLQVAYANFSYYDGGGASLRPHAGEARRTVVSPRHRGQAGRDRTVACLAPPLCDRDRARRVRQ